MKITRIYEIHAYLNFTERPLIARDYVDVIRTKTFDGNISGAES